MLLRIKIWFEKTFLEHLVRHIKINPSIITALSIVAMLIGTWLVLKQNLLHAAIFVFISGFFDVLDGTIAKVNKTETKFGAFFDRTADRINDMIILTSLVLANYIAVWLGLFVIIITILASYASACIEALTKTKIGEKTSFRGLRLIILITGFLFNAVLYAVIIIGALGIFAFCERFYIAFKVLRKKSK